MAILYGIKNCDTVKKVRAWLDARGVDYTFHDYKIAGVPDAKLRARVNRLGWEALLNRSGTTFRNLPEADKADLNATRAVALMLGNPSAIKRPVLERGDLLLVGFRAEDYAAALTLYRSNHAHRPLKRRRYRAIGRHRGRRRQPLFSRRQRRRRLARG